MTSFNEIIGKYVRHFRAAGFEDAPREVAAVARAALGLDAGALLDARNRNAVLPELELKKLDDWLAARLNHVPLARLRGLREFWGLDFTLNEATLEPRPDSETLIESVLKNFTDKTAALAILDIGTGTGCLLLSLLSEYAQAMGTGTDKSVRALEAARANAQKLGLADRAQWLETSWAAGVNGFFDVVISNPPYIRTAVLAGLDVEVKNHDPLLALDGGEDGLEAYRALLPQARTLLKAGGMCAVEVGYDQGEDVKKLFAENGFKAIAVDADLGGVSRVVMGHA